MKIEGSLLAVGLCSVSAITQEPKENPIAFLESLKKSPLKVNQSALRFLQGTGDFKGQIPVPMYIKPQESYNSYSSRTLLPF